MNLKPLFCLPLGSVTGVALACAVITNLPPMDPIDVPHDQTIAQAIGNRLHQMYPDTYTSDWVIVSVGIRLDSGHPYVVQFSKPCSTSFEDAGANPGSVSTGASASGGGAPGIGGGFGGSSPWTGCVAGCDSGHIGVVTVG